LLRNSNATKC